MADHAQGSRRIEKFKKEELSDHEYGFLKRLQSINDDDDDLGGAEPVYYKLVPEVEEELTKFAKLALDEYNKQNNTTYRFLHLGKVLGSLAAGMMYDITFEALSPSDDKSHTFHADIWENLPCNTPPEIEIECCEMLE